MKKSFSLLVLLFFAAFRVFSQGSWTQLSDLPVADLDLAYGFTDGTYGYVTGGESGSGAISSITYCYDPLAGFWQLKAQMPVGTRGGGCFVLGSKGHMTTGESQFGPFTELYRYNPIPDNWSVLHAFPGDARVFPAGFNIGAEGYIVAGKNLSTQQALNDCYAFEPVTQQWQIRPTLPGTARYGACGFSIGDKGYIFGGTDGTNYLADLWEYDPLTTAWTQKASLPGPARSSAVALTIGPRGYIMCGINGAASYLKDCWEYNPLTDSWAQMTDFPGAERGQATGFAIGNTGYIGTGRKAGGSFHDFWSFVPPVAGIPEKAPAETSVFPNPSDGTFTIVHPGMTSAFVTMNISDLTGRILVSDSRSCRSSPISLDLRGVLSPGCYLLMLTSPGFQIQQKLVIR